MAVSTVAVLGVLLLALVRGGSATASGFCPSGWKASTNDETGLTTCGDSFSTAGTYVLTIPSGVKELKTTVWGANGGSWSSGPCAGTGGGGGGVVDGTLKVKEGELLNIVVGGEGGAPNASAGAAGGTPGGGGAGGGPCASGGGGGSFLFGPKGLLLAAGGGGGGGYRGGEGEGGTEAEFWTEGLPTQSGEFSATGDDYYCNGNNTETCPNPSEPQKGDPCSVVGHYDLKGDLVEVDGYQFYGTGATRSSAGKGGQNAFDGDNGEDGEGPASSYTSPGTGGVGGVPGSFTNEFGSEEESGPGGGGGGGYFGGGGGSDFCGGGSGSDYWSPEVISPHYPATVGREVYEAGHVGFSFIPEGTGVSGKILTAAGDPLSGAVVRAIPTLGGEAKEATTNGEGHYSIPLPPGSYRVEPVPSNLPAAADEFKVELCEGVGGLTESGGGYCEAMVEVEKETLANFNAGFTLSGRVLNAEDKGVPGATVVVKDTEKGVVTGAILKTSKITTNGDGRFEERLAPGAAVAFVEKLNGAEFFPEASSDCKPQGNSCEVNLDQDSAIVFTTCVLPNPNGEPLPATTPEPIPGAIRYGQLEAVGCWIAQNGGEGGEATLYDSTKPVRLDGIDVKPLPGTTLQLDTKTGPTVTSNGPSEVLIKGWPIIGGLVPAINISLNFQGGSPMSVSDQGAGTGPLAPNFFGLPISLGTGGAAGYGLPFTEGITETLINGTKYQVGQTTISGGLQLPVNTRATWDPEAGVFKEPGKKLGVFGKIIAETDETAPSFGLSGSIVLNNRQGLSVGSICLSGNDLSGKQLLPFLPDRWNDGEISGAQVCYQPGSEIWEGSGMFKMPTALSRLAGDVFVKLALQKPKPSENAAYTGQFDGYKVQKFGLQFEHLNSQTLIDDGAFTKSRISGIPLGLGFYLQSGGAEFSNDLTTGKISEIVGTMGISYGPEVNFEVGEGKGTELSLLRGDMALTLQPGEPTDLGPSAVPKAPGLAYWTYGLKGALTFARLTPFELQLAKAKIAFHANPEAPEADFFGELGGSVLGAGLVASMSGQSDVPNGFLMEGTGTLKGFGQTASLDAILNNYLLGVCASVNGKPVWGFDQNLAGFEEGGFGPAASCDLGKFKHPGGAATKSAASHVAQLRLRHGLDAAMIAVRGSSAAPAVALKGVGHTVQATPTAEPKWLHGALVFEDPRKKTTYIGLMHLHAGTLTVRTLPGSAPITGLLYAEPGPTPRIHAKVVRAGCQDKLRYHVHGAHGETILAYARQGEGHVYVGKLHPGSGSLKLGLLAGVKGKGGLVVYLMHGHAPEGVETIAHFANGASNGSERPSHISVHAGTLRWHAACEAAGYTVSIKHGKSTTRQTTTEPKLKLSPGSGGSEVTITAVANGGAVLGSARGKVKLG